MFDTSGGMAMGCVAEVQFLLGASNLYLLHSVQTGSVVHLTDHGDYFYDGKVIGTLSWPLTVLWCTQESWSYTSAAPWVFVA
jgi:hypothetical protein